MNNSIVPLTFPMVLDFDCPWDRVLHLAVPKGIEIVNTRMVIKATNLSGSVLLKSFGTTAAAKYPGSDGYEEIDPLESISDHSVTSIIIDFHTRRTVMGFQLQLYDPAEPDLFCIIRAGSGGSWFLPTPVNLLELGYDSAAGASTPTSEGLPHITAEKLLLTFAKLKHSGAAGYVTHGTTNGNLYEQGDVIIEEKPLKLDDLSILCSDFLTNFSIRVGEAPPLLQTEGEFFTLNTGYQLPDFSEQINKDMQELVPLKIHSDMSGKLEITQLTLDYVRHYQGIEQTLTFEQEFQRSGPLTCSIPINIENVESIHFISMKLEGEFSNQRIIPSSDLQPYTVPDTGYTPGFQIIANKKAAQKVILSKTSKVTGIDLPLKFLDETVNLTVELRNDKNNQPGEKILACKDMAGDPQTGDKQSSVRDFSWVPVDFEEEIQLTEGTYWIVLESSEGEVVWQITGQTGVGSFHFLYAYDEKNSKWTPLSGSSEQGACAVYRVRRIFSTLDDPPLLQIKLDNEIVSKLTHDAGSMDILIEETVNIQRLPGDSQNMTLNFEAQVSGTLNIADLLIKYKEVTGEPLPANGFIEIGTG